MATKIFPSVNDVNGGVAGQGKTLTEANLKQLQALPYFDRPYVKSGATCTNGGGLNLNVAAGAYMIDGRWVNKDATESVLLTASQTCRVWLQLTKDGSGNVTGTTWNVQTGTAVPADAVLVAIVVTGASTITTITQSFRGIIAPGVVIAQTSRASGSNTSLSAAAYTDYMVTGSLVGDGIAPITADWEAIDSNDNSGAGRTVNYDLRFNGDTVGGPYPRTYDSPLNTGLANKLQRAASYRWTPTPSVGAVSVALVYSAVTSGSIKEGNLIVAYS